MNKRLLYYGKDEPLPERVPLRAGPLSLIYEQGDLRYVQLGNTMVLLRLYWAVRDRNWGTVATRVTNVNIDSKPDAFHISYDAICQDEKHGIDFRAQVTLTGDAEGSISAVLTGEAHSTFMRNRLGFCVLHPADQAAAACVVDHVDGTSEPAKLPRFIYAHQPLEPFSELRGLRVKMHGRDTVWANLRFEGDIFEMEDQRNWTDASFKTFCTPLRLPYPVEVPTGAKIRQAVTLQLASESTAQKVGSRQPKALAKQDRSIDFSILNASFPVPALGLGQQNAAKILTKKQVERLQVLKLKHLRVDLNLGDADVNRALKRAVKDATALGVPLEAALFINPDSAETQLSAFREMLAVSGAQISHWLIYPAHENQTIAAPIRFLVQAARKQLGSYNKKALFVSGTDADFIFANKQAQAYRNVKEMDAFCTSSNPQLHAFDNASLVETLSTQPILVQSAEKLVQNKPVFVTPLTLRPRWNPYTTGAAAKNAPLSDVRQTSLFGAGWLLGSIKYLAEADTASITYFETVGASGVMDRAVYPMWHVLADVADFVGGRVIASRSSEPLKIQGLVLRKGKRTRVILANTTDEMQTVSLSTLGAKVRIRRLDETNGLMAMQAPEKYRLDSGEVVKTIGGKLQIQLQPFGLITLGFQI